MLQRVHTQVRQICESWTETATRTLFFWETDEKRLGTLLRFFHHMCMYLFVLSVFLVHTFIPSYWYLVGVCSTWFLVWLQHIFLGGCVVSKVEQKFLGDGTSFIDPILHLFHIPVTDETVVGVVILGSTCIMVMLGLELTARTILNIRAFARL